MFARRQRKAASWQPAIQAERPSAASRRRAGAAGAGFDLGRVPAQAPAAGDRRAGTKAEDMLSVIAGGGGAGGPRAVGAPEYYEVDGSTPTGHALRLNPLEASPPTPSECGGLDWRIFWKLSQEAPTGGYIVQKVVFSQDSVRCPSDGSQASIARGSLTYWEAWPVNKGKRITVQAEGGAPHDDHLLRAPTPPLKESRGMVNFTTEARYYDGIDVTRLGFAVTRRPPTYDLLATFTDPQLQGGSNAVTRSITARWNCCATGRGATRETRLEVR